jgi:hypothetical protein
MSLMDSNNPTTPGGRVGRDMERMFLDEAEHERQVHEAERHLEEEAAERGEAPPAKKPWWKFWA